MDLRIFSIFMIGDTSILYTSTRSNIKIGFIFSTNNNIVKPSLWVHPVESVH